MRYSNTERAFYPENVEYSSLPKDLVTIESLIENMLRAAISTGMPIAQKPDMSFTCGTSDCDTWNAGTQSWVLDETTKRLKVKEAHKAMVKARRKELQYGWMLAKCTNGDLKVLPNEKNRIVIDDGASKVQRYGAVISSVFPAGLVIETGDGDTDSITIPVNCVEDLERMISLTTQMLFDKFEDIKTNQILADFNDTDNVSLEQFGAKNYVTDSGAYNDTVNTAIADDTVFAQPTTGN